MSNIKEATFKYKEYLLCPEGCGAHYHVSTFSSSTYECKDCRNTFSIPRSVKLSKPQHFKPRPKPEFKRGE